MLHTAHLAAFAVPLSIAALTAFSASCSTAPVGHGFDDEIADTSPPVVDSFIADTLVVDAGPDTSVITATPKVDLYAFQMWGAAACEVSILSGEGDYKTFKKNAQGTLKSTPPNGSIEMMTGDIDKDGKTDLYFLGRVDTNSKVTEIHVMNGANNYGNFLLAVPTGFAYAGVDRMWSFRVGDYNRDGSLDLWGIAAKATGSKKIEVHVVDGSKNLQPFIEHTATVLPETDEEHVPFFALADANKDGAVDLYVVSAVDPTSGTVEVTVLDGKNLTAAALSHDITALPKVAADGRTSFLVGDADGDGAPDLFEILRDGTASGMTEVTILSGADHFQTVLRRGPTALGVTGNGVNNTAAKGWVFDLAPP